MKKKAEIQSTFKGSIDDLLLHAENIDPDVSETQMSQLEYESCLDYIQESENIDRESAKIIYKEIHLAEVSRIIDQLVAEGYCEIVSYNKSGEPLYGLTERGKKMLEK